MIQREYTAIILRILVDTMGCSPGSMISEELFRHEETT